MDQCLTRVYSLRIIALKIKRILVLHSQTYPCSLDWQDLYANDYSNCYSFSFYILFFSYYLYLRLVIYPLYCALDNSFNTSHKVSFLQQDCIQKSFFTVFTNSSLLFLTTHLIPIIFLRTHCFKMLTLPPISICVVRIT